jgi:guanine deaminase
LAFSTRHPKAADALFHVFSKYNMRSIGGKVLMDDPVNAPEILRDPSADESINATEELILKWHNKGRNLYAITPRFAPTSTLKQMNLTGELMKKYPDVYMHTHLSESMGEIDWVNWQFGGKFGAKEERLVQGPRREDALGYLSVYDYFGMLGPKSVFAHSIHMSANEWKRMGETQSTISWCPTSNNFLGSGLFNAEQAIMHNVRFGMGTDVGAGTSFSMLRTMGDAYKVLKLGESWLANVDPIWSKALTPEFCATQPNWPECGVPNNKKVLSAARSFYTATMGGAKQLSLDDKIGNFEPGKEADFAILNWAGGRQFVGDRMSDAYLTGVTDLHKLQERLFVLMMMGDDRNVEATYVYGKKVFPFVQHS